MNVGLALALFPSLGVQGLALAWTGAYTVAAVLAVVALRRRVPHPVNGPVGIAAVRAVVAGALLAIVVVALAAAIGHATAPAALAATATAGLAGGAVYVVVLVVLRTPELGALVAIVRRRSASGER